MKRIAIIVEDDWELNGNGTGNVAEIQYLPARFLMDLTRKYGFKVTFMVEVLQQLNFRMYQGRHDTLRTQADLWDATLREMKSEGHDVQLHIHPQWHGAVFKDGHFHLSNAWNLATFAKERRLDMITKSVEYLHQVLSTVEPEPTIHSMKAGSWALQPSRGLLEDLESVGIRVVMGVGKGIYFRGEGFDVDYRSLQSPDLPYYPDYDDICRISERQGGIIVCPLAWYRVHLRDVLTRALAKLTRDPCKKAVSEFLQAPKALGRSSPMGNQMSFRLVRPLDIARNPLCELKAALDRIVSRALNSTAPFVPIVLQSHTKRYSGNWDNLSRFFRYMTSRFHDVADFVTLSEALPRLDSVAQFGKQDRSS